MQLVDDRGKLRLFTIDTRKDLTDVLLGWAESKVKNPEQEGLCGFVLKARSPSCGIHDTERFSASGKVIGQGAGLFASAVMSAFPDLPVEDEERLHDPALREAFINKISAHLRASN